MIWEELKAYLLETGGVRVSGEPIECYLERSRAGPGARGGGSIFFAIGSRRVRLGIDPQSPAELVHEGDGRALLRIKGKTFEGRIEEPALHCPRQAYITISEGCIFSCRYCQVPLQEEKVKTPEEVVALIEGVIDEIGAISLTSGVIGSIREDEVRVREVIRQCRRFGLPIGVSIYPDAETPETLAALGVVEVKFNLETATPAIFSEMCPDLDHERIWEALERSVGLFGKNHVFSNVILGLGETDEEMHECIDRLTGMGVIPIIRPLTPVAALPGYRRPAAERIRAMCTYLEKALYKAGLDPREALTMCAACTGCDLVPGRDT